MANEFVTRTGLIVSGSTFLPAATSASKGYILSFDTSTKEVYYMSTSSVTVTVPGSDTQVIYNNNGSFGAASGLVYSGSNVGIGKTSPTVKLDVSGSVLISGSLTVSGSSTFTNIGPAVFTGSITQNASTASFGGLVGIGTTTPSQKLDVQGDISVGVSGATTVYTYYNSTTRNQIVYTNNSSFEFHEGASERVRIAAGGNVGIGTTSPANKLDVNSGTAASAFRVVSTNTTSSRIFFEATSGNVEQHFLYTGNQDWVLGLDKADSNKFKLASADDGFASAKLTVTTGGNVGIGITSPSTKLEVESSPSNSSIRTGGLEMQSYAVNNGWYAENLYFNGATWRLRNTGFATQMYMQDGTIDFNRVATGAAGTAATLLTTMRLAANGNVGIGTTTPSNTLQVAGGVTATSFTGSFSGSVSAPGSTTQIVYNSGGALAADSGLVYSGSNVGIGTASPDRSLLVSGSIGAYVADGQGTVSITVGEGSNVSGNIISLETNATANTTRLYNNGTGTNFNIGSTGTTSDVMLSSRRDIYFKVNNGGDVFAGTTTLFVSSSGFVGIGATSPESFETFSVRKQWSRFSQPTSTDYTLIDVSNTTNTARLGVENSSGGGITGGSSPYAAVVASTGNRALQLSTSGSVVMTITGSNVGIGTTTPGYRLEVKSGASNSFFTSFTPSAGSGAISIYQDSNNHPSIYGANASGNVNIVLNTNGVSYLQGGNVIVGGSNDDGATFQVKGNVTATSFTGSFSGSVSAPGSTTQIVYNSGGALAADSGLVYSGSNVGIGTTNPNYKLDVSGVIRSKSGTTGTLYLGETSGGTTYVAAALIGTPSTTYNPTGRLSIQLPTHGVGTDYGLTEQMSIQVPTSDSKAATMVLLPFGGNVGIGTTAPTYNLEVSGSGYISGSLTVAGTITAQKLNVQQITSSVIYSSGSNIFGNSLANTQTFTGSLQVTGSTHYLLGDVGIGITSPNSYNGYSTLTLNGSTGGVVDFESGGSRIATINNPGSGLDIYTMVAAPIVFGTDTTARMTITSGGNVGIGTTNPSFKLNVIGGNGNQLGLDNAGERFTQLSFLESGSQNSAIWLDGTDNMFDIYANTSHGIRLKTGGDNTRLTVTSGGNVLIGTTTDAGQLLYVNGTSRFNSTIFNASRLMVGITSDQTYASIFVAGDITTGSNQYAVLLDPQLSGTTNYGLLANARIKASHAASIAYGVYIANNEILSGASIVNNYGLYIANQTNGSSLNYALYSAGGTSYFAGSVGIGTTSPSNKLYVSDTVEDYVAVIENLGTGTAKNGLWIKTDSSFTNSTVLKVTGTTSDSETLQVNPGQVRIGPGSIGQFDGTLFLTSSAATVANFVANNSSALFISGSGNIGIGTTSPTYTLTVGKQATSDNTDYAIAVLRHGTGAAPGSWTSQPAILISDQTNNGPGTVDTTGLFSMQLGRFDYTDTDATNASLINITYDGTVGPLRVDGKGNTWIGYDRGSVPVNTGAFGLLVRGGASIGSNYQATTPPSNGAIIEGNVGIGITSSFTTGGTAKLSILGSSVMLTMGASTSDLMYFRQAGAGEYQIQTNNGGNDGNIQLQPYGGKVGIGTTTPLAKLHVSGAAVDDIGLSVFQNSVNGLGVYYPAASFINVNGNHSYGIVAEFKTDNAGTNDRPSILFYGAQTTSSWQIGQGNSQWGTADAFMIGYRASNTPSTFSDWPSSYFTVLTGGNVGIGTTTPNQKLSVEGGNIQLNANNAAANYYLYLNKKSGQDGGILFNRDNANDWQLTNGAGNGDLIFYSYGISNDAVTFKRATGNVGIGTTSPSYKLQVSGAIAIENQGTTTIETTTFSGSLTTNTNIASVPTASFKAAFFDYYVASGSVNMRAGTVMAVHNNSTSRYTDTSTADIGTTAAVDFSTSIVAGSLVLTANISSGTWEVKTAYRAL